ncbi:MAG TPA: biopolymer transporter ExbD [Stenomitos sp.]
MQLSEDPDIPARIELVPMIDVIFAILTFFIFATFFVNRNEGLPVNLPQAKTARPQVSTKVAITLRPNGDLFLNRTKTNLERVEKTIRDLTAKNQSVTAIINADQRVEHGNVVKVMDRIRQIEGAKLAIATQQPRSN